MLVSLLFCNYFKLPSDQHKASLKAKFSKHSHKSADEKILQTFAVILLICSQQNFSFIAMILYRKKQNRIFEIFLLLSGRSNAIPESFASFYVVESSR